MAPDVDDAQRGAPRTPIRGRSCRPTGSCSGSAVGIRRSRSGRYRRLRGTSHDVYAYERATAGESIIVAVNFGGKETPLRVRTGRRWTVLFDTHERPTTELVGDDHLTLAPHEAIILVAG